MPNCTSCRLHVLHIGLSDRIGRIDEKANHGGCRHHLAQQLQPLWPQRAEEIGHARGVATRAVQAADKPELDWITAIREDDWSARGCGLCCLGRVRTPRRGDHSHMTADEIIGEGGQSIVLAIGPTILNRRILALDIAGFAQAPTESGYAGGMLQPTRCRGNQSPASPAAVRVL